jgi:hypothetical protein
MQISRKNLRPLIDDHFHKYLDKKKYLLEEIDPLKLLDGKRLDVAIKLLCLELSCYNEKYAKSVYLDHLKSATLGKFREPGNKDKKNALKYIQEFENISRSIFTGFDNNRSVIPCTVDSTILNGTHRTACAIFHKKKVFIVKINADKEIQDHLFYAHRNMARSHIEASVIAHIGHALDSYVALIWPAAKANIDLSCLIPNVIYKKKINLNKNGAHNLIIQLYCDEQWLGEREGGYKNAITKVIKCFPNYDRSAIAVAFQASSLEEVIKLKEKIRDHCSIGKHAIHITGTREEAKTASKILFNDNAIHFLNFAKPYKHPSLMNRLYRVKEYLNEQAVPFNEAIVDGSLVLEAYGIREAKDIDLICMNEIETNTPGLISTHIDQIMHHNIAKEDLIFNPKYYFEFEGIKFVSFDQLMKMKSQRGEEKDLNDISMMKSYMSNGKSDRMIFLFGKIKSNFIYLSIKIKVTIIETLTDIGIYKYLRPIYKKIIK